MHPLLTSSVNVENSSQCIQSVQIYFGYEIWSYVYWLLLTCLKFYVMKVYLSVSLIIWLILCIPLTIQVCWFVVICMCSNYQSHRLVPGDWLSLCYRKQSFTCWCCSTVCCTMHLLTVPMCGIVCLKRDGTCAETRFHLAPKRTSPFKSVGRQFSWLLAAEVCASALVMLDTPSSEVVNGTG
jgi:hypothetical protein